jgi:RNA polymerase sigma-70 factor (ECF subfamily)
MFKKERKHARVMERQIEYIAAHEENDIEEQYLALRKAVDALSDIEKALVMLYFEDYSHQEMAAITGITTNNVAVRMNRIKTKLKENTKKFL